MTSDREIALDNEILRGVVGSTTYGKYNQVIANVKYYVQQEWSNASHACALTYVPTPVISSFTPESGASGATVTLTGANYNGTKTVTFNGTSASFTVLAPNTITAKVPLSATSGLIAVTNAYGTTKSSAYFWIPPMFFISSSITGLYGRALTATRFG